MLRRRSKIEKIRLAKLPRNTVHASNNMLKKDSSLNTVFGLLFEGNQNCCLTETTHKAPVAVPKAEPEIHQTVDMCEDDKELQEQARIAKIKKDEEEREARQAARDAAKEKERLRKLKETEEK